MTLLLILAASLAGCREDETGTVQSEEVAFPNTRPGVEFVGDAACYDCHEEEYRGYQEHGMARSLYALSPETAHASFTDTTLYHEASNFYYRVYREGNKYFQEEYRLGPDGKKIHRLVREMKYAVGSGTVAHTYLTENKGRYYELPVTWYTQAGTWDFSPGFEGNNLRFERLVPDRCMACHNSYPEAVSFVEGKYESMPEGIGCERCHGPGELHVDARLTSPEAAGEVDSTIVNPAHLPLDRRLDVCQQCHLHTSVSVLREGQGAFDFRPSEPLSAHVALFSEARPDEDDRVTVISHADRLKESACFLGTQESPSEVMDCVTCHDPHEGFRNKGPSYFNETCQSCHAIEQLQAGLTEPAARENHTATANCISCHMPKVEAEDAPHASFTDHKIRVVQSVPETVPLAEQEAEKLRAYFERDREETTGRRYEGVAYIVYGRQQGDRAAFEKGIQILREVLKENPEHGRAQFLLGYALMQLGRTQEAVPPLEQAVRLDPGNPEWLNALAQAYETAGRDPTKTQRLYERALSIQPAMADVRVNYGRYLETEGQVGPAIEQYRRAREERPWLATTHYNLGTAYLRQGRREQGEEALLQAVELRPNYAKALGNLGLLYAQQGQTARARTYFERALQSTPDDAVALGNLGTLFLNEGNLDRAVELLQQAVEADPTYVDGLVNLALAYFRSEQYQKAHRYARQALQINPAHPRARQIVNAVRARGITPS